MELEQLAAAYGFVMDKFSDEIIFRRGTEIKKFDTPHQAELFFKNW